MSEYSPGPWIIVGGIVLILVGALVWAGAFSWFGKLPGDIHIEGENSHFFFPLTTMIVISLVLTVILNIVRRLL